MIILWIITTVMIILAVSAILGGVVAMIKVRLKGSGTSTTNTPAPAQPRKFSWSRVIGIAVIVCICIVVYTQANASLDKPVTNAQVVNQNEYDWYWKLPRGQSIRGRNEAAVKERTATLTRQSDGSLRFSIYFKEYGSPEVLRLHLVKVGSKTWEGTWEQDNPADHGRLALDELPNGYSGEITWRNGLRGRCHLIKK